MLKIDNFKRDIGLDYILNGYFFLEFKGILMPYLQSILIVFNHPNIFLCSGPDFPVFRPS